MRNRKRFRPDRLVLTIAVAAAIALGIARVVLAANYTTYYCGDASTYCTVYSDAPKTTASTALRDDNNLHCASGCYARIYYYSAGTGSFGIVHSGGYQDAIWGYGSGSSYVYSRCIAESGYGPYSARCWTDWHT